MAGTQAQCQNGIVIGYNTMQGKDPQPIYAAGSPDISCVVGIETLATASIQKAIFDTSNAPSSCDSNAGANLPGMSMQVYVAKCGYSGASGQAYIVHNIELYGKASGN